MDEQEHAASPEIPQEQAPAGPAPGDPPPAGPSAAGSSAAETMPVTGEPAGTGRDRRADGLRETLTSRGAGWTAAAAIAGAVVGLSVAMATSSSPTVVVRPEGLGGSPAGAVRAQAPGGEVRAQVPGGAVRALAPVRMRLQAPARPPARALAGVPVQAPARLRVQIPAGAPLRTPARLRLQFPVRLPVPGRLSF